MPAASRPALFDTLSFIAIQVIMKSWKAANKEESADDEPGSDKS